MRLQRSSVDRRTTAFRVFGVIVGSVDLSNRRPVVDGYVGCCLHRADTFLLALKDSEALKESAFRKTRTKIALFCLKVSSLIVCGLWRSI
jgi:hypothetical protein